MLFFLSILGIPQVREAVASKYTHPDAPLTADVSIRHTNQKKKLLHFLRHVRVGKIRKDTGCTDRYVQILLRDHFFPLLRPCSFCFNYIVIGDCTWGFVGHTFKHC